MEQGPGALNGEVKADDPAAPGSVGQRARELCFCQETAPSLFTPCSLQQHQDLHPYSEMSVLTRPHFLGSKRPPNGMSPVGCYITLHFKGFPLFSTSPLADCSSGRASTWWQGQPVSQRETAQSGHTDEVESEEKRVKDFHTEGSTWAAHKQK